MMAPGEMPVRYNVFVVSGESKRLSIPRLYPASPPAFHQLTSVSVLPFDLCPDSFKSIETKQPDLIAIDSEGNAQHAIDLFEKEKHETSELTRAHEISPGFYVGLTQ